ncbi:hypothetical protein [Mesorhizobium sp. Root695]|nr:hypothetical protein [Mesorhizobium sp. Root695]
MDQVFDGSATKTGQSVEQSKMLTLRFLRLNPGRKPALAGADGIGEAK